MQDEYRQIFLSPQAIDGRTVVPQNIKTYIHIPHSSKKYAPSSVATGGAYHRQEFRSISGRFARVSPSEEKLKEIAEELQRHVLERERRAMEELEDELAVAEFRQGRDVGMPEGGVGSAHERAQLFARELVRGDVKREHGHGEIDEGVGFPVVLPVGRQRRDALRDV